MADLIRIRYGELGGRTEMPKLQFTIEKGCEIAFRIDEEALYIGTPNGNVRLCGANDLKGINSAIEGINAEITKIKADIEAINTRLAELAPSE